jgi:hypothetical protein
MWYNILPQHPTIHLNLAEILKLISFFWARTPRGLIGYQRVEGNTTSVCRVEEIFTAV